MGKKKKNNQGSELGGQQMDRTLVEAESLLRQGRVPEADAILIQIRDLYVNNAPYYRLSGQTAGYLGDAARARSAFRKAVLLGPNDPANHIVFAQHLNDSNDRIRAMDHLRTALKLSPGNGPVRLLLAQWLREEGDVDAARREIDRVAAGVENDADGLIAVAQAYERLFDQLAAIRALRRALALRPGSFEIENLLRKLYGEKVERWHFPMMNDGARNDAYEAAIRRAVTPDSLVLEIGAGSGLLSMMAARAGAKQVIACEQNPLVAEAASENVRLNGYADRVTIIPKRSSDLVVGVDLPRRADILVSEVLSDSLLSENVLEITRHARQALLEPDARLIPYKVGAVAALMGGDRLAPWFSVGSVSGFDLSAFNRFVPNIHPHLFTTRVGEFFSDPVDVFEFDLRQAYRGTESRVLEFTTTRPGPCVGVLQWIKLWLDEETVYANPPHPEVRPAAWRHNIFPFPGPILVEAGDRVAVQAGHDDISLYFAKAPEDGEPGSA